MYRWFVKWTRRPIVTKGLLKHKKGPIEKRVDLSWGIYNLWRCRLSETLLLVVSHLDNLKGVDAVLLGYIKGSNVMERLSGCYLTYAPNQHHIMDWLLIRLCSLGLHCYTDSFGKHSFEVRSSSRILIDSPFRRTQSEVRHYDHPVRPSRNVRYLETHIVRFPILANTSTQGTTDNSQTTRSPLPNSHHLRRTELLPFSTTSSNRLTVCSVIVANNGSDMNTCTTWWVTVKTERKYMGTYV